MYFKKLELLGFKSFLNKTTLHFEPGITAVVGPNGTGKSNIFDSIRWVLGEQSVKALRGSDMQDVIFNGTDSKEPLSMAEVTLTFDNSNRFFNLDQDEVAITRRIFRSAESEYLLNKSLVRLKDVLDLLSGTGIGAESYSLVAQGKIDLILSSRPEDRRLVFDEAAGITKYKARKLEAGRKLEETEQNLARVNDIIAEVKRQIGSLERQANKARRYQEVFEEVKLKEINLAIYQKRELLGQKDAIINQLQELKTKEQELLEAIKTQEAKISHRQQELKDLTDNIMAIKNEILNLENLVVRNKEHISFNQERITELEETKIYLTRQISEGKTKLIQDEEKLSALRQDYSGIHQNIQERSLVLKERDGQLNKVNLSIKTSLENIAQAKKEILGLAQKIANTNNEITASSAKQQIYSARQRRIELEKAKVGQEKALIQENLKNIDEELEEIEKAVRDLNAQVSSLKNESNKEGESLNTINAHIGSLEKEKLSLESHKELIEKLKTEYEGTAETLNAVVYLDKLPTQNLTGLVVKIRAREEAGLKLSGEAKPFDLDTQALNQKLSRIQEEIDSLKNSKLDKQTRIEELNQSILELEPRLRHQDIALANKKTHRIGAGEQFNKIKEEEDILTLELSEVEKDISIVEDKLNALKVSGEELNKRDRQLEEIIANTQNEINVNGNLREKVLLEITQGKAELEALTKRLETEETTLKILEDSYQQDKASFEHLEKQNQEAEAKLEGLNLEIKDCEDKSKESTKLLAERKNALKEKEDAQQQITKETASVTKRIELDRMQVDTLKNKLYELQMQDKDLDFKFLSLKERLLQNYKLDLEAIAIEEIRQEINPDTLLKEIQVLKEKLDSFGSVNLVAIEEYDELKKRYDFLVQQQNDLIAAKDSLHEAISKINRTTKKMFLETFARVREEFRNYFRLLFNGGEAQVFLLDEQDALESGIEIICRPPGRKLQNVLLLSGGEKALSAIALIFAIFKVKPSPFCILDEIDAALDEANVDRFSQILKEFTKESQFIVITHNKRTIAKADVMYGITMEESGVSKIVSVKFSQDNASQDKEPAAQPVAA